MGDQAEKLREIMQRKNGDGQGSRAAVASSLQRPGYGPAPDAGAFVERPGRPVKRSRIISITSGKGGVGKTNIAVNVALAYARMGKKVVVMDADLGLANVNVILNIVPKFNLYHVIRKQKTMREIMINTDYGISIVAGASGFSRIANLGEEDRQNFIKELNSLANADIVIIDTSAGVSNNVLDFVAAADDVVIVTTPEPTAITDAYGIIKIIATEIDSLNMGLNLVVNRAKSVTEAKKVADRMTGIAGQFLNLKLDYMGFIYDDATVSHAVIRQKPFMVIDPKCRASLCIEHIVSRLEKTEVKETGGFGNMFKRIIGRNVE
jgi:flagellar biosynthesis protein FlhG